MEEVVTQAVGEEGAGKVLLILLRYKTVFASQPIGTHIGTKNGSICMWIIARNLVWFKSEVLVKEGEES